MTGPDDAEVRCPTCHAGDYTTLVSATNIAAFSRHACDDCAAAMLAAVRRDDPDVVADLPPDIRRFPLLDPARHVDLDVADQIEKWLTTGQGSDTASSPVPFPQVT